jgi:hypothetical protein
LEKTESALAEQKSALSKYEKELLGANLHKIEGNEIDLPTFGEEQLRNYKESELVRLKKEVDETEGNSQSFLLEI